MKKTFVKAYDVKVAYINQVIPMMIAFYGDVVLDLEYINNLKPNETVYFIVRPRGTHIATNDNYDAVRDDVARVFGNYVVIKIVRIDEDLYEMTNWDKLISKTFDTENETLIQRYKDFEIKNK